MSGPAVRFDVAVVGGGVIGLAVAWRAAARGMTVGLVDDARPHRATWAAAGMLAPVTELHPGEEALLELNRASAARYPRFVAEVEAASGQCVAYRRCGTLTVALDAGDVDAVDELYHLQRRFGLVAERLRGSACRKLEPALAVGVRGGVHAPEDHQVDNRRLAGALREAGARAGVVTVVGTARRIESAGGAVETVVLADGSALPASRVVVTAGCWSGELEGTGGTAARVIRPLKGQILRLRARPFAVLPERTVRALVHGSPVYAVPRADGELVVGATMEEQGDDATVTAGAVHDLLRDGRAVLPGIAEAALVECGAGLRPATPDNLPLIGRPGSGAPDGLLLAAGHGRNGILLTPLTADAVVDLLDGVTAPGLDACRADRFAADPAVGTGAGR
jgi:glycine oxidase